MDDHDGGADETRAYEGQDDLDENPDGIGGHMKRRLGDQALILQSIGEVRKEFRPDMTTIELADVVTRIGTLYSLLDVERLAEIVGDADVRGDRDERKVA